MCRSLYENNSYDLIPSKILKKLKQPKQNAFHIDLNLGLGINRKKFHSDFPSRVFPQFIGVSHPRKFLYILKGIYPLLF